MSAFLKAYNNIGSIQIDKELIPLFASSMLKFHNYFEKHNLYSQIDLDTFFEKYLFTNTHQELIEDKIKIKLGDTQTSSIGVNKDIIQDGSYNQTKKTITCFLKNNSGVKNQQKKEEENNENLQNFIHEFVHFLTLHGEMEINGQVIIPSKELDYFAFNEALTQNLTNKIMGTVSQNHYPVVTKTISSIEQFFNFSTDKAFISRDFTQIKKFISSELFDKLIVDIDNFSNFDSKKWSVLENKYNSILAKYRENDSRRISVDKVKEAYKLQIQLLYLEDTLINLKSVATLYPKNSEKKYVETLASFFEMVKYDLLLKVNDMTVADYTNFSSKLLENLPVKTLNDYSKLLTECNEIFIENYLLKNKLPLKTNFIDALKENLNKLQNVQTLSQIEKSLSFENVFKIDYQHLNLVAGIRNNNLILYNLDIVEHIGKINDVTIPLNKFKEYDTGLITINFKDVASTIYKDENQPIKIYGLHHSYYTNYSSDEIIKFLSKKSFKYKPLTIDYKDNNLIVYSENKSKTFDITVNNKEKFINNFPNKMDNIINKFKEVEKLQNSVTTTSLVKVMKN